MSGAAAAASRAAEVVLDVDVEHGRAFLVLANCGDAVATDVRVKFSRTLFGIEGTLKMSTLPIFARLGVLRPGRTLRVFWDAFPALLVGRDGAEPFTAIVSWTERSGVRQTAEYRHDLSIYRRLPECLDSA